MCVYFYATAFFTVALMRATNNRIDDGTNAFDERLEAMAFSVNAGTRVSRLRF